MQKKRINKCRKSRIYAHIEMVNAMNITLKHMLFGILFNEPDYRVIVQPLDKVPRTLFANKACGSGKIMSG